MYGGSGCPVGDGNRICSALTFGAGVTNGATYGTAAAAWVVVFLAGLTMISATVGVARVAVDEPAVGPIVARTTGAVAAAVTVRAGLGIVIVGVPVKSSGRSRSIGNLLSVGTNPARIVAIADGACTLTESPMLPTGATREADTEAAGATIVGETAPLRRTTRLIRP